MHGNELRKTGRLRAAVARLNRAVRLSTGDGDRGAALALLARAAGEHRNAALFDESVDRYRRLLDASDDRSILFNPFTFREIQLRGLLGTGRAAAACRLIRTRHSGAEPPTPHWRIIERVTAGEVLLASKQRDEAEDAFRQALAAAEVHHLPHQIQRTSRAAELGQLSSVLQDSSAALHRLNEEPWPRVPDV